MVAVHHAVLDKWDEPHERVHKRVDEHESQLAVNAHALTVQVAGRWGRGWSFDGRWSSFRLGLHLGSHYRKRVVRVVHNR